VENRIQGFFVVFFYLSLGKQVNVIACRWLLI